LIGATGMRCANERLPNVSYGSDSAILLSWAARQLYPNEPTLKALMN
jgi:hypothetical protein